MPPISLNVAALAVAVIFYTWRGYAQIRLRRDKRLRERVAFMLWTMVGHVSGEEFALTPTDAEINLA
jgi:hypothetical protein